MAKVMCTADQHQGPGQAQIPQATPQLSLPCVSARSSLAGQGGLTPARP